MIARFPTGREVARLSDQGDIVPECYSFPSPASLSPPFPPTAVAAAGRCRTRAVSVCAGVKNALPRLACKSSAMFAGESMIALLLDFFHTLYYLCIHISGKVRSSDK